MAGPRLDTLPLVMAVAGSVLLYGAVTNRNPVEVVKLALSGGDITTAAPISTPGVGPLTDVIPGKGVGTPGDFHSNGAPRMWPNGTPAYSDDPNVPASDPRRRRNPDRSMWRQAPMDATRAQGGSEPYTGS